jgi:RNA polymerase sigma-70 factor, ECF subfamily
VTRRTQSPEPNAVFEGMPASIVTSARDAWPAIHVPAEIFASYVADRLPDGVGVEDALQGIHMSDLYLACACTLGDAAAVAVFDRHCLAVVDRTLPRLGFDVEVVSEVKQRLRYKLLVPDNGPPGIADFAGRGDLRRWVRVMAVHEAMGMARAARRHVELEDETLNDEVVGPNPELDHFKRLYGREFQAAFTGALGTLSEKERLLLKQQFLDGLGVNEIARLHRVHRATASRWLERARAAVLSRTRIHLMQSLGLPAAEFESIMRLIRSDLDMTLRHLFRRHRQ